MGYDIKPDNTQKNKWYCVLKNPTVDYYDTKVIYGGSPEIVERKVQRQLKKWEAEAKDRAISFDERFSTKDIEECEEDIPF